MHEKKRVAKRPQKLENRISGTTETEEQYICSNHLEVANSLFVDILQDIGQKSDGSEDESDRNVLYFCVAGQNRSAGLAVGVLLLNGMPLEHILRYCAEQRSFVLENTGFQRQIVELEVIIQKLTSPSATEALRCRFSSHWKLLQHVNAFTQQSKRVRASSPERSPSKSEFDILNGTKVEVELLIPGLCSLEVSGILDGERRYTSLTRSILRFGFQPRLRYRRSKKYSSMKRTNTCSGTTSSHVCVPRLGSSWLSSGRTTCMMSLWRWRPSKERCNSIKFAPCLD